MAKRRQKASIWTYVLLGAFGLAALATVALIAAAIVVPRMIDRTIERYTDAAPASGQPVEIADREYAALKQRVESFAEAVDSGGSPPPLELTSDEVAALIQRELQAELNRGGEPRVRLWLRIEDDLLKGPVSVKMDEFATGLFDGLRGRYLNGVARLDVSLVDQRLRVHLVDFAIDGEPLPGWVLDGLREAIDRAVKESRRLRDLGRQLDSLEIRDDRLMVRARPAR